MSWGLLTLPESSTNGISKGGALASYSRSVGAQIVGEGEGNCGGGEWVLIGVEGAAIAALIARID